LQAETQKELTLEIRELQSLAGVERASANSQFTSPQLETSNHFL